MTSFKGEKKVGPQPNWSAFGVKFKIPDEHPRSFHMGVPPHPPVGQLTGFGQSLLSTLSETLCLKSRQKRLCC